MPSHDKHVQQILQNRRVLAHLNVTSSNHRDCCATVVFYIALHQIDRYLATKGVNEELADSHKKRNWWIQNTADLKRAWTPYRRLYDASIDSRYLCKTPSELRLNTLLQKLDDVEQQVSKVLGQTI